MSASTRRWPRSSTSPAPSWPSPSSSRSIAAVSVRWSARVGQVAPASVSLVRVGLEALATTTCRWPAGCLPAEWELRVLNPGHVAMQRKVNGQRGVKTDKIDLAAIADLLLAGRGVIAPPFADPVMTLTGWVAHRRRRSLLRRRTIQQLTTHVDRCFPGLGSTMWSVVLSKAGRLVISELADPARVARLGPSRLRTFAANRGVRMTTPLAERIVEAARQALPVPGAEVSRRLLAADLQLLADIEDQIATADLEIEALLPQHPLRGARHHTGMGTGPRRQLRRRRRRSRALARPPPALPRRRPHPAALRISRPPQRRPHHPRRLGPAPRRPRRSRHGPLAQRADQPHLRRRAPARGKPGGIIVTAMAHRANKIAFAMVRDQQPWEPSRWAA